MDNQYHQENNTYTSKSINNNMHLCCMCRINNKKEEFVLMVHKWREYDGYSKYLYPRYFCSAECLEIFKRDFKCNHCHIVTYEWNEYKKGPDSLLYCNDEREITIGDTSCYNLCFPPTDIKSSL
jgi:hypothetical protein